MRSDSKPQQWPMITEWDRQRSRITTRTGGMRIGEKVDVACHGYSLLDELIGHKSCFQVLVLQATGRLPERRLADWLEAVFLCVSYPDARIWCNQIGSLAGTLHASPSAAVSAGILASDSRLYGPGTLIGGADFIAGALRQKREGLLVREIVDNYARRDEQGAPLLPGYARPALTSGDERIAPLEKVSASLGFKRGEHLALAFAIHAFVQANYRKSINSMGYCTAFLLDQGFSGLEQSRMLAAMVMSGVLACYAEAADQPGETFLPMRCTDITYVGKTPRKLP